MSIEENKENIHRIIEEVYNKGDLSVVDELVAPSFVVPGSEVKGPEGIKQFATMIRTAFPDWHMTIDDMVAEGDTVAMRCTWTGTNTGNYGEYPPTGKKVTMTAAYFYRFEGGKQVETLAFMDQLSYYQQLGVSPPTG